MTGEKAKLTAGLLAEDAVIFGLRLNEGVELDPWRALCPAAPWGEIAARIGRLQAEGLLVREGGRVRLSDRGRLVADAVGAEFIGLSSEACPEAR